MAVVTISKVKFLKESIKYISQDVKTKEKEYIYGYGCTPAIADIQFKRVTKDAENYNGRKIKNHAWMIIQSFKPNETTPDQAFEIGKRLADNYLGTGHQYILTTHIDKDHLHNHIIFNATNFETMKSFDSKTKHLVHDLRKESNKLSLEYGLSIIEEPQGKGISQKEWQARKHDRSFKAKLEKLIDAAIDKSSNWDEFINNISETCDVKYGTYLAFKQLNQERYTRAKKLGIDYYEESIKYRIKHKNNDLLLDKFPKQRKYIDTSDERYAGIKNIGLKKWAEKQNIQTMAALIHEMYESDVSLDSIHEDYKNLSELIKEQADTINSLDNQIKNLEQLYDAVSTYKESAPLIQKYKQSLDKATFKKENFIHFKKYDNAKKIMNANKLPDGKIPGLKSILEQIETLTNLRSEKYEDYHSTKKQYFKVAENQKTVERILSKNKSKAR